MSTETFSAADREFLRALADVVFRNPFTREREAMIRRLAPEAPVDLSSDREALARVVTSKVAPLVRPGALEPLSADDRLLLEPALLYLAYHRYVPQLDAHIERQAQKATAAEGNPTVTPIGSSSRSADGPVGAELRY